MNDYQLSKLPRYAQSEIIKLRKDIESLEAKLYGRGGACRTDDTEQAPNGLYVDPYPNDTLRVLPVTTLMQWTFPNRGRFAAISVRRPAVGSPYLDVNCTHPLIVHPWSGNAVHLKLDLD